MQHSSKAISPLAYYCLIASLTNLPYVLTIALATAILRVDGLGIAIIVYILLMKGLTIGAGLALLQKCPFVTRDFAVRVVGSYFGKFYGLVLGGCLGYQAGNVPGVFVGALVLFFVGRAFGHRISIPIARVVDGRYALSGSQQS